MIVVDTNIIGYLYLNNDQSALAEKALLQDSEWAAPVLWRSELRNVLALYIRKELLTLNDAVKIMEEATSLMQEREYAVTSAQILQLVKESACSAYDCEFVALARDLGVSLVTADQKLWKQFPNDAILLREYVK